MKEEITKQNFRIANMKKNNQIHERYVKIAKKDEEKDDCKEKYKEAFNIGSYFFLVRDTIQSLFE